ncbi:hypothetical protein CHUAL_005696 [Chamberlinius hualienensis]
MAMASSSSSLFSGSEPCSIPGLKDFYKDRSVFITGATGFMGKVLVEKLLRSCTQLKNVYVLMRPKAGHDVRRRLEELLNAKVFENLKKEQPEFLNKLVPIGGDITLPGLGISPADEKILTEKVSVVFHSAATVKFDEGLKRSIEMNVQGTRRLVDLCHKMPQLVALVHVSTAYCNCNREEIDEVVYPMPSDPRKIVDAMEWMDDDLISAITPQLLGDRPNTYTYTKALAECMLLDECGSLPVAIVRPSIVVASWKEPFPGWVDNLNGPTGLMLGCGKGVIRTIYCSSEMVADFVPVDVPINMMISVAWYTATYKPNNVLVYNCTSGGINRLTWGDIQALGFKYLTHNPMNKVIWYPGGSFKASRLYNDLCAFVVHFLPAYCLDALNWATGKKPFMINMQHKIARALNCLAYFTSHEWRFTNQNLWMLWESMTPEDRQTFNFDLRQLHWPSYMEHYCLGIKLYILKEDLASLTTARRNLQKMYIIRHVSHLIGLLVVWRMLMIRFNLARRLWYFMMSLVIKLVRMLPFAISSP